MNRLVRVRVRCDGCDGTGLCAGDDQSFPHSCCGDCSRAWVPASWVPAGFNGGRREPYERTKLLDLERVDEASVLVGTGWVWGSLWQRLLRGGSRERVGVSR